MSSTVKVRYVGAVSPIDVPSARLGNVAGGDVVEVPADVAGRAAGGWEPVGEGPMPERNAEAVAPAHHFLRVDEHGQWHSHDPGEGLLAQADNWEPVTPAKTSSKTSDDKSGA